MVIPWSAAVVLVSETQKIAKRGRNHPRFTAFTIIQSSQKIQTNPACYDEFKDKYIGYTGKLMRPFFDGFENASTRKIISNLQDDAESATRVHAEAALMGIAYGSDKTSQQLRKHFMDVRPFTWNDFASSYPHSLL